MFNNVKSDSIKSTIKLFDGERSLVVTGLFGFILTLGIGIYIIFQGSVILPEGNMKDAFSFNAAIGIFILSIAAILPFANLRKSVRKAFRCLFIIASIYAYAIETIQNFRGINPRFSREGSIIDTIGGMVFGVISLLLIILALLLMIKFFQIKVSSEHFLLIISIRYAFISVFLANLAGLWMILLQDRFTGDAGNLIVLHGIGFHALQTLLLPGWLLERSNVAIELGKRLIHIGSISWMISILLIGLQTLFGRSVFELSVLPIFAVFFLITWLGTALLAIILFIKNKKTAVLKIGDIILRKAK